MIIRKFISSLSNVEKGELIRALADVAYKGKGIVFDYLYELASFIEQEPDKKEEPAVKKVIEYRNKSRGLDLPAIQLTAEEQRMIIDKQIMRAIRNIRERTAQRLAVCREAVEAYQRELGNPFNNNYVPWHGAEPLGGNPFTLNEIEELKAHAGPNKIVAIKWVREKRPGTGLKEAKEYVESLGL